MDAVVGIILFILLMIALWAMSQMGGGSYYRGREPRRDDDEEFDRRKAMKQPTAERESGRGTE